MQTLCRCGGELTAFLYRERLWLPTCLHSPNQRRNRRTSVPILFKMGKRPPLDHGDKGGPQMWFTTSQQWNVSGVTAKADCNLETIRPHCGESRQGSIHVPAALTTCPKVTNRLQNDHPGVRLLLHSGPTPSETTRCWKSPTE